MPGFLVNNWELKLVSLAIASALWVFVVGGEQVRMALGAPVEYTGLRENLTLLDARDSVDVEVEAPRWAANRIAPGALRVRIDLATAGEGESLVAMSPTLVQAPPGVTVTRITPSWVRVAAVAAITRAVQVVPQIRGTPAPRYAMRRVLVQPTTVEIRGPRSTIEKRGVVETLPVEISGSRETIKQTVGLVAPEAVSLVRERAVQVTVEIAPEDAMPSDEGKRSAR
jgi:YbbR domain-containing protein